MFKFPSYYHILLPMITMEGCLVCCLSPPPPTQKVKDHVYLEVLIKNPQFDLQFATR